MFVFFIDLAPLVWSWTAKVAPREKQWTDDFSHLPGTIRMIQNHPDAPPSDLHNNSQPREPADFGPDPEILLKCPGFLLKCRRISCSSAQDSLLKCPGFLAQVCQDFAKTAARLIRGHWEIENSLHWSLDVVMNDDDHRARKDHAPENFAILRRIALNIIKGNPDKGSNRGKFQRAGWDNNFLTKLIQGF